MNKKLELIELEPYEAPALYEIAAVETLHGEATGGEEGSGGITNPSDEDDPPDGEDDY